MQKVKGNLIDITARKIKSVEISFDSHIRAINEINETCDSYLSPGFIDAHVHIESSMMVPSEFARMAVMHGTVGTVSDPHEIANVLGIDGVKFMINNAKSVPFKFNFGAPSCVPATTFETAGAVLDVKDTRTMLEMPEIKYLAEMMNWPGVLHKDSEVMAKLEVAKALNKPIDGHAPGLKGDDARSYASAGISTDHESFELKEALDKIDAGMKIIIREGSAAKNFEALHSLLSSHPNDTMLCSDDKHPDSLLIGHINQLVARALAKGHDIFDVLKVACLNPIDHYKLEIGSLNVGDPADFIVLKDISEFEVSKTFINGQLVFENGITLIESINVVPVNKFECEKISLKDIRYVGTEPQVVGIQVIDEQLVTKRATLQLKKEDGYWSSNPDEDVLKLVVINRYQKAKPAVAFINKFGLKNGALASTVAHDSHNIIAVGTSDKLISQAINLLIDSKGGISAVGLDKQMHMPLEVAGLMSAADGFDVAKHYTELDNFSRAMGSSLKSPFMSLSFMALLVIPEIKLSDLGLFDGMKFEFIKS